MAEEVMSNDVDKWTEAAERNSIKAKGKLVKQVITFRGGYKTTFKNVKTETIEQGKFTHFETEDGRLVLINDANVFCVEVFK